MVKPQTEGSTRENVLVCSFKLSIYQIYGQVKVSKTSSGQIFQRTIVISDSVISVLKGGSLCLMVILKENGQRAKVIKIIL